MTIKTTTLKDRIINIAYFLFFLGVAIFALYYCFRNIEYDLFISTLKQVDYFLVVLSILIGVFATTVRAVRWNIMINPLGYNPPFMHTCNALMIAYMSNLAIPRAGELIRCASLHKTDKIPINTLFGTVVSERIFDMLCLLLIIVLAFFLKMQLFTDFIAKEIAPKWQPMLENISTATILLCAAAALLLMAGGLWLLYYFLKKPDTTKI
ncbi:MAG: flippase-like domain-containing protein, partial [Prevotellaceae bacterium]|nr:flippase-like domain-containing protein [Prevotellaceae bacterium]